jgi:mRNA interferase RelE/StbE
MPYVIEIRPRAEKDLDPLPPHLAELILTHIYRLKAGLGGNIKRLKHHHPDFRLRVGDWRVLFEVAGNKIIIHRVLHRREAYR